MENNITVNMENLSEEERDQLIRLIQKSNGSKGMVWKPEYDEWYFYVSGYGVIGSNVWINDYTDNGYYEIGNCFKTEEEAKVCFRENKGRSRIVPIRRKETMNMKLIGRMRIKKNGLCTIIVI